MRENNRKKPIPKKKRWEKVQAKLGLSKKRILKKSESQILIAY